MSIKEWHFKEHVQGSSFNSKRLFDITLSLFLVVLALPLCLLIALLVKTTSHGPLFYVSQRLGKEGRPFNCWKFRTMCPHAEEKLREFLDNDPELLKQWSTFFKLKRDPRVTKIGRFLRKTSLDELPQLWNVLKGDLSLVGPRPYLENELREVVGNRAGKILSVRPGLTGLWQVSGRNELPFLERIRLDEEYVNQRSFRMDFMLLCRTIPIILFAKGH